MAYSKIVLDHYENPRNVGKWDPADNIGTGMVGAPACGDVMRLQIKVEDNIITDAKFKTYGWVKGMSLETAAQIKNTDLATELALPPVKIHCSVLAEDAIKAAIADYKSK
jgi:nitrogen fixation protein NifU and related proteins